jgi:antitoxin ParD1/3/4
MENAEKISITMTPDMMRTIRASVSSGEYASTSEVLRDAVRIWRREREERSERLAAMRQRVEASLADPRPNLSAEDVRTRLDALHAEIVRARAHEAV